MPNAQCPLPNAQCHHVHHRTILPQVEACAELTATGEKRFDAREFAFLVRYVRGEATPNPNPNPLTPTRTPTLTPTPTPTLTLTSDQVLLIERQPAASAKVLRLMALCL